MENAISEIRSELEAIERDDTLYEVASFGSRLEALDAIEVNIIKRVEGLLAVGSHEEGLLALWRCADVAQSRLEAIDERLFDRLRVGIRSGEVQGAQPRRRLRVCARCGKGDRVQDDGACDNLDALLSSILLAGAAPGK